MQIELGEFSRIVSVVQNHHAASISTITQNNLSHSKLALEQLNQFVHSVNRFIYVRRKGWARKELEILKLRDRIRLHRRFSHYYGGEELLNSNRSKSIGFH